MGNDWTITKVWGMTSSGTATVHICESATNVTWNTSVTTNDTVTMDNNGALDQSTYVIQSTNTAWIKVKYSATTPGVGQQVRGVVSGTRSWTLP